MVLTLSNTEHGNALDAAMCTAGVEALIAADSNPDVRSVVIAGEGSTFCTGASFETLLEKRHTCEVQAEQIEALHSWIEAIRSFPKPVIAAVEGMASNAGFSLALACDFIVAAESATFGITCSEWGPCAYGGMTWSLAQSLPRQLISELLMTGERATATRLQQWGMVNQVAPAGAAFTQALAFARKLEQRAPQALAGIKELVNDAANSSLSQQMVAERALASNLPNEDTVAS